jgi:GntR family transcriptional regulator/MocR family aminotransferase
MDQSGLRPHVELAMDRPTLTLDWQDSPSGLPLFQRIAESVAREIRRGRLKPGAALPSSRSLAATLGVHRNTALAAFAELEKQGLIVSVPARGTFVSEKLPEIRPRRFRGPDCAPVTFDLPETAPFRAYRGLAPTELALFGGLPDLRHFPSNLWRRAYRHAVKDVSLAFDYQSELGEPRLLRALASYLATTRGVVAGEGEMLVTRGSQLGLHLAARALTRPGTVIAVEARGYRPAWEGFRLAGAELVPVPVDEHGLVVSELERLTAERRVAAVYTTPHHQYPTTATLSAPRRLALLSLAAQRGFPVIEDDYDHEYHFDGRPILPLASADPARVVVHVGTLSKVLAPGLRIGYVVARPEIVARMAQARFFLDRQGDHVSERALAYLIEDGELTAHIRKMKKIYAERREVFIEELRARLGDALRFRVPPGGLAVWARVARGLSPERWAERALSRGLLVQSGNHFTFDGKTTPYFRLGFPRHDPKELREAVRRLAASRQ